MISDFPRLDRFGDTFDHSRDSIFCSIPPRKKVFEQGGGGDGISNLLLAAMRPAASSHS